MKKSPVLSKCPVCSHDLLVKKLGCANCETTIEGNFTLSKFNYLDTETLYFIEVFVKNRGNIKAIEKELNISYPTVKKMLDEAIIGLGYKVDEEDPIKEETKSSTKTIILDQLKEGKLSVQEVLERLKK